MAEETQETEQTTEQTPTPSFFDGYSDELKAHPGMERFKDGDQNSIANSYLELESKFGHDKMVIPKADDAEGFNKALVALGKPETSEGYALSSEDVPEGLDIGAYKELAHKAGLLPSQASKMWDEFTQMTRDGQTQYAEAQKKEFGEQDKALRGLWGAKYEENTNIVGRVAEKFTNSEDDASQIKDLADKNPTLKRLLAEAGNSFSEHSIGDFKTTSFTNSPAEAQAKIAEIRNNPNHAVFSKDAKIQAVGQAEMDNLYKQMNRQG